MAPGFALRIQSMMRAMREVVIPAIPPDRRLALDQANIIVGNLRIMAEQHDRLVEYELAERRDYTALLRDLLAAASGIVPADLAAQSEALLSRAVPLASVGLPTQNDLAALVRDVKAAADATLQSALDHGAPDVRATISTLVLAQAERQVLRERRWTMAAGFELDPASLPSLDALL